MNTYIHIGQHKTATTSIQNYLKDNKNSLASRGLYVPNSVGGSDCPSHYMLNIYSLDKNRFSTKKEKLLKDHDIHYLKKINNTLKIEIDNHYLKAKQLKCNSVIWSNEGLYLLNSIREYQRLSNLFIKHSSKIICICCFRDVLSFRQSYINQLNKSKVHFSDQKNSYKYTEPDSWLFDYKRKKTLLNKVFCKQNITLNYQKQDMVTAFMESIDFPVCDASNIRLNIS